MADLESLMNVTKAKIGELISKPKMSDKLLSKPPFRFLHDTITAITTTTGFGEGLYSDGELDSAAITEKQAKLNYLDKSFRLVGICKGALLDVKSSKVVSGLEPEFTNMFLIALAECASDPKFDNAAAVRRALNGENPGDNPPPLKSISDPRPMIAESKSEPPKSSTSKSVPAAESESKSSSGSAKAVPAESKLQEVQESSAAPAVERGKSRGGTRGGKPNQASTDIGISGISGAAAPNLDSEIEKCDGSEAATQALLGSLITRPKLTEKLLSKPPFRFLHDIVMEVIKATGFATGLYSPAETDSANVADKTQKMTFLEKIIKLVGVQLNTLVEAKPARIVAGMDAQNTNNWLQLLAVAAKNLPDSRSAVRTVLDQLEGGGGGGSGPAPSEPQPAVVVSAVEPEPVATSRGAAAKQEREVDDPPSRRSQLPPQKPTPQEQQQQFAEAKEPVYAPPPQQSYPSSRMEDRRDLASAPASDEKMQDDSNIGGGGDDTESKRSSRPTTARRRPPKVKDGAQEIQAKDIASTAKKAEGIIIDGAGDEVDEEDDIKPSDDLRLADEMRADFKSAGASSSAASERNDPQSKLVKDIMSRQAEQEAASRASSVAAAAALEDSKAAAASDNSAAGATAAKGIRLGQLRKTGVEKKGGGGGLSGGAGEHDLEKIRSSIQLLVQHTGPLGTCMDYIQEDISMMTAELHRWEEECRKYEADYAEAKARTKELLQPLRMELNDVEDEIAQVIAKIATAKAATARKDNEIQQVLRLVVTA